MEYITNTLGNLVQQTAFLNLTWGNYIMIAVACFFLYLATASACTDCIWYAPGKYLPGYHASCRRFG